ncbi:MAG TPA: NAD(P)/FAD-dependent oxidoreductase [Sandaracinaceae bacterium LLY-WYZ-13_1]|nr:NAD(P)/FAD-dependent oxidoreductase [Sandaracinaceae bacterium LLY-WYZ-13_1]
MSERVQRADVVVVGAGFGGLGTALSLAERGADVLLLEQLAYPGGCASTFIRRGCRHESGATLFSGFGEGQLFAEWIGRHDLDVRVDFLDPVVTLRTPSWELAVPARRDAWIERLTSRHPDRADALRRLFAEQGRAADALWSLFADPGLLPPFGVGGLFRHLARAPRYLPLLRWIGQPLSALVARHGLSDLETLTTFLDAVCQITVQTSLAEAEAPFAMATMDYYFRGTGHVHGGIGRLAWALVEAFEASGGRVRMPDRVKSMARRDGVWRLETRRGPVEAPVVVANLLPQNVTAMLPEGAEVAPRLLELAGAVEDGWGAVMLYLVVEPGALADPSAHHLELVADPSAPFLEGNHLFCSVAARDEDRAPDGGRTVTISTHVPMKALRSDPSPGPRVAAIQDAMRRTLASLAPELSTAVRREMTASPRTFERFTGRHLGYVGGIPRRHGWHNYRHLWPAPVAPGLYLVGDTVFPGQSTLATALGGVKLADHLAGRAVPIAAGA